ncbi:sulfur carrier protein ThiS [Halomonas halocynthiae]|uniref:sulfur carrier protein ThiS n=1 Tax=Halomonas halocynthiae TaxID=176290 RepID=UPI00040D23BD|nr:sulfur carrier protein ThiS [Halomonas halocynthiae]
MQIQLNGEAHRVEKEVTVAELVEALGLAERRIAVEVNEHIVPKSSHLAMRLVEGDRIEIVHAIGGG